jgi:hypothetical protein
MAERKVHLRPSAVVNLGTTKTFCGKVIYSAPQDMTGAVVEFNHSFDATIHGTLVTCGRCLRGTVQP